MTRKREEAISYVTILILLFFVFSVAGWLWEVGLHLVQDGVFVKRGVLSGPWLPIYGTGGVMIMVLLHRFFNRPLPLFFLIMGMCGVVEYLTGWFLETYFHTRWWDYSNLTFQIQGRVCLAGLLVFGLGGLAFVYLIRPGLERMLGKLSLHSREILCMILLGIFFIDLIWSLQNPNQGAGISKPVLMAAKGGLT